VVDDDEIVLEVTRERLEAVGYQLVLRTSGLGTSAAVLRERPDFLLLDLNMPALDGEAIARLIGANGASNAPAVILYSASDRTELLKMANRCGAVGIIQKTSNANIFYLQLKECTAAARRRRGM